MKKTVSIIMAMFAVGALCACGNKEVEPCLLYTSNTVDNYDGKRGESPQNCG